jgi:hypothetical protein
LDKLQTQRALAVVVVVRELLAVQHQTAVAQVAAVQVAQAQQEQPIKAAAVVEVSTQAVVLAVAA